MSNRIQSEVRALRELRTQRRFTLNELARRSMVERTEPSRAERGYIQLRKAAGEARVNPSALKNYFASVPLFESLVDPVMFEAAAKKLGRAKGKDTPGVDGLRFTSLKKSGALASYLLALQQSLTSGMYVPSPLRRTSVRKPEGRKRLLGIPTIADRVVQHALLLLLTPIAEVELPPVTYASRPGLGPHHALHAVEIELEHAPPGSYIIRTDIHSFFDRIPHRGLVELLRRRIQDERLIGLIWQHLNAWAKYPYTGIAQGAPLSPLLANWCLADIDRFFAARKTCAYVRYMDDILIIVHGDRERAEQCLAELKKKLASKGLRLAGRKTTITGAEQGAEFLGLHVRRDDDRGVVFTVTDKNIARFKNKVGTEQPRRTLAQTLAATAAWLEYFSDYDKEAGQAAIRFVEERTGIRGLRYNGGGKPGPEPKRLIRTEPKQLHPIATDTDVTTGTQPPPGGAVREHSPLGGPGESFAPAEVPLTTLSDRGLRRHWGHCRWHIETLGSLLDDIQQLIHEARDERAEMRTILLALLRRNDITNVPIDAVLERCPAYRRVLAFENEMSSNATDVLDELKRWKSNLREIRSLLSARSAA